MSIYRSYGTQATNTPSSDMRPSGSSGFSYASPQQQNQQPQSSYSGYQAYGSSQPGMQQSISMQPAMMGSVGGWNAPNAYGAGQSGQAAVSGTPQAPKQFSWGLPIQNYTPKSSGDEVGSGSPESMKGGTPSHTPSRANNPLYPIFDADDEAPPRESTLGMDDDDIMSSPAPPPAAQPTASPQKQRPEPAPAKETTYAVVVFGFTPASQQIVLQAFKAIGEVAEVQAAPYNGANWLTVAYRKQWDASLATRKSGEVIGGTMIGVKWADGTLNDTYVPPPQQQQQQQQQQPAPTSAAQSSSIVATPNRSAPPLGERLNVLSANEALKKPSAVGSPGGNVLARLTGAGNVTSNAAAPTSPHANLFKQPQTPNRGLAQTLSTLVFGE